MRTIKFLGMAMCLILMLLASEKTFSQRTLAGSIIDDLALKLELNGVYGFTGSSETTLLNPDGSTSTFLGQQSGFLGSVGLDLSYVVDYGFGGKITFEYGQDFANSQTRMLGSAVATYTRGNAFRGLETTFEAGLGLRSVYGTPEIGVALGAEFEFGDFIFDANYIGTSGSNTISAFGILNLNSETVQLKFGAEIFAPNSRQRADLYLQPTYQGGNINPETGEVWQPEFIGFSANKGTVAQFIIGIRIDPIKLFGGGGPKWRR